METTATFCKEGGGGGGGITLAHWVQCVYFPILPDEINRPLDFYGLVKGRCVYHNCIYRGYYIEHNKTHFIKYVYVYIYIYKSLVLSLSVCVAGF